MILFNPAQILFNLSDKIIEQNLLAWIQKRMKVLDICCDIFMLVESHLFLLFNLLQLNYVIVFQILKEMFVLKLFIFFLLLYFITLILFYLHYIVCELLFVYPYDLVFLKTVFTLLIIINYFPDSVWIFIFVERIFWSRLYHWLVIYGILVHQFILLSLLGSCYIRFFDYFFLLEVDYLIF